MKANTNDNELSRIENVEFESDGSGIIIIDVCDYDEIVWMPDTTYRFTPSTEAEDQQ